MIYSMLKPVCLRIKVKDLCFCMDIDLTSSFNVDYEIDLWDHWRSSDIKICHYQKEIDLLFTKPCLISGVHAGCLKRTGWSLLLSAKDTLTLEGECLRNQAFFCKRTHMSFDLCGVLPSYYKMTSWEIRKISLLSLAYIHQVLSTCCF